MLARSEGMFLLWKKGKGGCWLVAEGESKDKDAYVLAVKITPDGLTGGEQRGSAPCLEDMAQ